MSATSTTIEPMRVFYGTQEEALNPDVIDFSFETVIPVIGFAGDRFAVRVRSTWNGLEEVRGHIARLEERALQAEADLRHVEGERRLSEKEVVRLKEDLAAADLRIRAAERETSYAAEVALSLRGDQFGCERIIPLGDVDGCGNVWVRLRSTEDGVGLLLKQLSRLDERAVLAEAALEVANARARASEARADRADENARDLRRAEFQWEDTIPVDEINGKRILVRVRGTEGGIKRLKAFIAREEHASSKLHESLLAAEAKLAALEAEQAESLASIAGFEVLPYDATTYTVSHGGATMTVTGSPSGVANVVKLAYGGFEYGVSA